jgi:hypothetical protein
MAFDALYRRAHAGERGGAHASQGARNAGFAAHAIEQPASRASGRDWVIAAQGLKNGLAFRNLARLIFTSLYRLAPRVVNALVVVQLSGGIVPVFACMAGEGLFPGEKNVGGTRRDRDDMNGKRGRPTLVRHNRRPPFKF